MRDLTIAIQKKWAKLARREQVLFSVVLCLALGISCDLIFIQPPSKKLIEKRHLKAEREAVLSAAINQRKVLGAELDSMKSSRSLVMRKSSDLMGAATERGVIWTSIRMNQTIEDIVHQFQSDLVHIAVEEEGVPDEKMSGLFRHSVEMEVLSDWDKISAFMSDPRFSFQPVDLLDISQTDRGEIGFKIKFRVWSPDKNWGGQTGSFREEKKEKL